MNLEATKDRTTKADKLVMASMAVCFLVTSVILVGALVTSSTVFQTPVVHAASTTAR